MSKSAYLSRLLASMPVVAAIVLSAGPAFAEPSHGDYVGKTAAEITENLGQQGYKFSEIDREDGNSLEAEVELDGKRYEIFADPRTGKIVKIIEGDEINEISIIKCAQRSIFVRYLADTYAEKSVAIGVSDDGSITEFLKSKNGDSWTIVTTTPNGMTCKVAAGKHWELLQPDIRPLPGEHLRKKARRDRDR